MLLIDQNLFRTQLTTELASEGRLLEREENKGKLHTFRRTPAVKCTPPGARADQSQRIPEKGKLKSWMTSRQEKLEGEGDTAETL